MGYRNPNSFIAFQNVIKKGPKEPARSNLFGVEIGICAAMGAQYRGSVSRGREHYDAINYLMDSVEIPPRRLKTQAYKTIGTPVEYAYGQQSQTVKFSFLLTKDLWHRQFIERWMNICSRDSENRVTFYDEYTANIMITKWEVGSNIILRTTDKRGREFRQRQNRTTGVWQMYGCYPYDMSAITLDNGPTQLVKMNVDFRFERYRFDTIGQRTMSFGKDNDIILDNDRKGDYSIAGWNSDQVDASFFGV
jgi:hypothetical protein